MLTNPCPRHEAPPQETFPGSLSDAATANATSSGSSSASRWDELRKSRAAPPSKWDTLRDSNARSRVPPPSSGAGASSGSSPDEGYDCAERELMADRDSQAERERRRKEFDALFEREAHGGEAADEIQERPSR